MIGPGSAPSPPPWDNSEGETFAALSDWFAHTQGYRPPESELRMLWETTPEGKVGPRRASPARTATIRGVQKPDYARIKVPVLAMYGDQRLMARDLVSNSGAPAEKEEELYLSLQKYQQENISRFERGVSKSRVVVVPGSRHHIFISNAADVLREMRKFMETLQ